MCYTLIKDGDQRGMWQRGLLYLDKYCARVTFAPVSIAQHLQHPQRSGHKILPHLFLTSPSRYGRLSSEDSSMAEGREPSGTGTTTSICHGSDLQEMDSKRLSVANHHIRQARGQRR